MTSPLRSRTPNAETASKENERKTAQSPHQCTTTALRHHTPTTRSLRDCTTIHTTATASVMGTAIAAPAPQRVQDHSTHLQRITYSLVHLDISTGLAQRRGKRVHRPGVIIRVPVRGVVGVVRVQGGLMRRRLWIWAELKHRGLGRIASGKGEGAPSFERMQGLERMRCAFMHCIKVVAASCDAWDVLLLCWRHTIQR